MRKAKWYKKEDVYIFVKEVIDEPVMITLPEEISSEEVMVIVQSLPSFKRARGVVEPMSRRRIVIPKSVTRGEKLVVGVVRPL